jgi:virginiamycin B lyase
MAAALALAALCPAGASAVTTIQEFTVPTMGSGTLPRDITMGPDGALWFTEVASPGAIGRITTAGQVTNQFPVPGPSDQPTGITVGSDGNLWFTQLIGGTSGQTGRITPAGAITEFAVPGTAADFPDGITAGPDGALWYMENLGNQIARMTTAGVTTNEYGVPTAGAFPSEITVGPDNNMWFTESLKPNIGRITTAGAITEFPIPSGHTAEDIVAGPDGALWFTTGGDNTIGRITTNGAVTEFPTPANSVPTGIAAGPDGAIWFTEIGVTQEIGPRLGGNKIGRMTTAGMITNEYTVPTASSEPTRIVTGPDGAIWFTEYDGNKIGRLVRDVTAPKTSILTAPGGPTTDSTPTFTFSSSEAGSKFLCSLDGSAFVACASPLTLPRLDVGRHTLSVRAVDPEGNVEAAPASVSFEVVLPPPVLGKQVNAVPLSGSVFVSLPAGAARVAQSVPGLKGRRFIPLREARQVPVGSILDTRKGRVRLQSARNRSGATQSGEFSQGVFQVLQSGKSSARGLTELRLKGASFKSCKRRKSTRKSEVHSAAKRSRRRIRRLRSNAKGRFRTRGRYSAATVRGTIWTTTDRCDGTLTSVRSGTVTVRDLRRKKNVKLRRGKSYLAKAP